MTSRSNRIKTNNEKKKIKKWPFFVFVPVGLINLFLVFCVIMGLIVKPTVAKNELSQIEADFHKWTYNGFCLYEELGGNYLHFPDGKCDKYSDKFDNNSNYFLSLASVSKGEFLLVKRYFSSSGKNVTDIIKTNLLANDNHSSLLSLNGNFDFMITEDWKILLWDYHKDGVLSVEINVESATYTQQFMTIDEWEGFKKTIVTNGSLKYYEKGVLAKLPNGDSVSLDYNNMDQELLSLFKKWNFKPSSSRRMQDNTITCAFYRDTFMGIGQDADFLVQINNDGEVIAYQYLTVKSKWYEGERIFPIYEELPDTLFKVTF